MSGAAPPISGVAHVLCELVTRMQAVGLAHDGICNLPLTQAELADATGLSTVHVNRVIQELRRGEPDHAPQPHLLGAGLARAKERREVRLRLSTARSHPGRALRSLSKAPADPERRRRVLGPSRRVR